MTKLTNRLSSLLCGTLLLTALASSSASAASLANVIGAVQPKMVKIYGAGGLKGLEAYQSGFLISSEGHVLTVWSYVLDTDFITVTLNDGRKHQAELVGADPRLEIAVLKIDSQDLDYFNLDEAAEVSPGGRILAFSNLYGVATGNEPASVLHGVVSARTRLAARRGAFESPYQGPVYVLDAMTNNPGAAGGALTDRRGRLVGLLGKELRNAQSNIWLNYAVPIAELAVAVEDIRAGRIRPRTDDADVQKAAAPLTLSLLGVVLVPNVLDKTPPFIDRVVRDSPADRAGVKADDLILFLGNRIVPSCTSFSEQLQLIDRGDAVKLTLQRGQELLEVMLTAD